MRTIPVAAIFVVAFATLSAHSQTPTPSQPATTDPLAIGKQALAHQDYTAALAFFTQYGKDNPDTAETLYLTGNSALGLKQYSQAELSYNAALAKDPNLWPAHKNLVIVFAAQSKWPQFDAERALIKDTRAKGTSGLSPRDSDVIDLLEVGSERYIVRDYATLAGRFKTRYNFYHFGPDNKLIFWISCESDDIDQTFFAKDHPAEAAAGQRSFSLDSYTAAIPSPDGKTSTQTHGTIKFYPDGEPTYETVRTDVLNVLQHKTNAMTNSTINKPASKN